MGLHERMEVKQYDVIRVPGGWIYERFMNVGYGFLSTVFIPYNNEFYKKKEQK